MKKWHVFPILAVPVAVLWFVFVVCAFSNAGTDLLAFLVVSYGGLLWGVVWGVRLIVSLIRQRPRSVPPMSSRRAWLYWGFEPATWAFSAILVLSGLLPAMRFRLSAPALQSYVSEVVSGRVSPHGRFAPSRRVGLYTVTETELVEGGVVRIITSRDGFNDAGFVYAPASNPPRIGEDYYTHITGPWWHWHRSW